ncbi:putative O-glycosylation ligase, exosortase A system-associated [Aliiglaciecola sp. CAU 1673]|uniref:putative O-glycosylation ligase, exosortase A system-associated n=1 Tax=Aliiglaciecola sp. CAU 1673 TaxID=3032595 RepID=UPI0023D9B304|nr:putative O-glycosylation ligase, exosortase A system-associated [Aliiglaciecola sp. CAU 1673]MDF2177291.1 putative O-glycosylation ligase, exosortase A system-associated [Aliiglaciecola sp. CAU 1673]
MRDIALFLLLIGTIPLMFRRPFVGVLVWCWISYMLPHKLTWGFMYNFPVAQMIAIFALAAYAFSKEPKSIPMEPPIKWLIFFYVLLFLCWLFHEKTAFTNMLAMKVVKVQFFTLVILAMLTTRKRIEMALWVIALSIGFYGVKGGIYTLVTGGAYRVYGPDGGFFEENNAMAIANLMVIPVFLYLSTTIKNNKLKILPIIAAVLTAAAVFGSHSRGAFLALTACAFFLWTKSNKKMLSMLVILAVVPVLFNFMPEHWHERMATIFVEEDTGEERDSSANSRLNAWRAGFNMSLDHPFAGGFNAETPANWMIYAPNPEDFVAFHSNYIQVLGKHGWIALFAFLMIFYSSWRLGNKIYKQTYQIESLRWAGLMCRFLQVSIVAYMVGGAFLSLAYFDLPYHFVITIVAVHVIVKRELAELEQEKNADDAKVTG